jgi:hypothetical protein
MENVTFGVLLLGIISVILKCYITKNIVTFIVTFINYRQNASRCW